MSIYDPCENREADDCAGPEAEVVTAHSAPQTPALPLPAARPRPRRVRLPVLLLIATCLSTLFAGFHLADLSLGAGHMVFVGVQYALSVITVLACHEAGHFFQARRYGVYTSYPYFIPMPISPLGTFGAVIAMDARIPHRRALFDIGITGPLAGLIPTIVFCIVGLRLAEATPIRPGIERFGDPLLLQWLARLTMPPIPEDHDILLNPFLFAGWVGLLVTAINLMPIGQLDGGHVLYALLRTKARRVASTLLFAAIIIVIWEFERYGGWSLMLFLLLLMRPGHPPTGHDDMPLGPVRTALGWLALAFIPIGFTPTPFIFGG